MKAQHRRRAPYRPRREFAIGILGLAICVLGIGLVMADVLEKTSAGADHDDNDDQLVGH
jgi:hypothetical protein